MSISIILHNNTRSQAGGGVTGGDIFVTVNDLNQAGGPVILAGQRINLDQTFPINVQEDGNGSGNILWNVQNVDGSHANSATVSVTDGSTVELMSV
jgi:hypothetical protein